MQKRQLPEGWDADIPSFPPDPKGVAGRDASGKVLNAIAKRVPWLIGGAADLAPSTKTRLTFDNAGDFEASSYGGRNFHFGIREHAMGSIVNGLSLAKLRPYGSGFLIFSDYMRAPIRLSALMELPVIYIFTHDSIGVGEDGPTHQPVEQLISLRAIPGLITLRPGDANEVAEAWRVIMQFRHEPVCLILSRQNMPTLDRTKYAPASGLAQGAYILADAPGGNPDVILIGTGSEVSLCVDAYEQLTAEGIKARVVSMPSWELFEHQTGAVPRERAASGRQGARFGRAGFHLRLGSLCRPERSACTPSAPPRRSKNCRRSSDSLPTPWSPRPKKRSPSHNRSMRTAIGSDHAGFEMKTMLARFLRELCEEVVDVGTHTAPIRWTIPISPKRSERRSSKGAPTAEC